MDKNWCRWLGVVAAFLFIALIAPAYAEDYVSKDMPPDDVLLRALKKHHNPGIKIIGKFQENDKKYVVFVRIPNEAVVGGHSLVRLDTNIWILDGNEVVQK